MLSDRSYMRDPQPAGKTSVLAWLIAAIVAGYILQNIFLHWFQAGSAIEQLFALSIPGLHAGRVWTLLTYSFLHSPENLLHIVCNVLGLYFLGRELLPVLGSRRFLGLYFSGVVVGGAVWSAVNWHLGGAVIGASAGVMALLIVFACLYPNQEVTFLLFFILPVTMKPKYLALACVTLDLFGCVFYEVLGNPSPLGFAHSAHLGGAAAGWLYFRFVHSPPSWGKKAGSQSTIELPRWLKRAPSGTAPRPAYRVNIGSREDLRAEVDRILDKINSQGFGALTSDEKRLLDEAKDLLSRR